MRRARASLLGALLALLAGCADEEAPRCASDDDCEAGRRCVREAGVCVRMTIDSPDAPLPDAATPDAADAPPDAPFD